MITLWVVVSKADSGKGCERIVHHDDGPSRDGIIMKPEASDEMVFVKHFHDIWIMFFFWFFTCYDDKYVKEYSHEVIDQNYA